MPVILSPSATIAITYSSLYVKLPQCELVMRDDIHSDNSCESLFTVKTIRQKHNYFLVL